MTKKEKWIDYWCRAFKEEEAKNPRTVGAVVIGNTVAVMTINTTDNPRIGVAMCSPGDDFDLDTGLAIAYCRMIGMSVPDCVLIDEPEKVHVSEIEVGEHFRYNNKIYVKTSRAKNGICSPCWKATYYIVYCLDTHEIEELYEAADVYVEPIKLDK